MSLKAIEMQVALPRTFDAGKIQEQLEHRGQNLADHANEAVQKEVENQRQNVIKNEHSSQVKRQNDHQSSHHDKQQHQKKGKEKDKALEQHPYKGTIIDYSR